MSTIWQDLRYAIRMLAKSPGFTAVAVLTLALGMGATTAIFSAVNSILFEPLPYPHAGRVAMILEISADGSHNQGTFGMYRGLAERTRTFDAIAALKPWRPTMAGAGQPEKLDGQRVSASYFQVLGVSPIAGRDFQSSDDRLNGPNVVILSDRLWQRRFGGDRAIIGHEITLDESSGLAANGSYRVIGVMPSDFENVLAPSAELWTPLQYDMSQGTAWGHHLRTVGRLRPGVTMDQATREINALGRSILTEQHPETYGRDVGFIAVSLQSELTRGVKPALLALLAAVALVLLIACANVTNLLLARGVRRRGEFALRAALGAGRGRLVRQLLVESLLLSAMGGAAGMAVAMIGVDAIVAVSPPDLPRHVEIAVNGPVFAFGLGITTLIGLAFGLAPALHAARSDPHRDLQQASPRTIGGYGRIRRALVVAEVAIALVLLVSSGLLLRSLERLFAVPSGFDAQHLLTMQVEEVGHRYDRDSAKNRFWTQALEAVRRVPGVASAGLTSQLPLSGDLDEYGAHFSASPSQPAESYSVFRYAVSPAYIETMRIPLLRGRLLDDRDRFDTARAALISESLANLRFAGSDPIGQSMSIGPNAPYTIVGVVGNVRQMSLALGDSKAVYIPASQSWFTDTAMSIVARTRGDAASLAPAIRQAIWSVDKGLPVERVATMDGLVVASAGERRFALILFEAFALAALALAAAGIYGVLSGSVAERTHEIGIRLALGAQRREILRLVLTEGAYIVGIGVVTGLVGALGATRLLASLLFGVTTRDPLTLAGVTITIVSVAFLACFVPARRAARVDPLVALRYE